MAQELKLGLNSFFINLEAIWSINFNASGKQVESKTHFWWLPYWSYFRGAVLANLSFRPHYFPVIVCHSNVGNQLNLSKESAEKSDKSAQSAQHRADRRESGFCYTFSLTLRWPSQIWQECPAVLLSIGKGWNKRTYLTIV